MIAAIQEPNPVVFIDDRRLYREEGKFRRRFTRLRSAAVLCGGR
jgi:pyruvate/2-oxoglutarate/acetoin dehydrogenase E1 component